VPAGFTINEALSPPDGTTSWKNSEKTGDYKMTANDLMMTGPTQAELLRIFLVDTPDGREFTLRNSSPNSFRQLQIWYNGAKKIKLEHPMSGLIYAPHAVVEVAFNAEFKGAIVARRIVFEGNNSIYLDKAIANQNFTKP
jgi:hypothetical protein